MGSASCMTGVPLPISIDVLSALLVMVLTSSLGIWFDVLGWRSLFVSFHESPSASKAMAIHLASEAVARTIPGGVPIADGIRIALVHRSSPVSKVEIFTAAFSRRLFLGFAQGAFLTVSSLAGISLISDMTRGFPGGNAMEWLAPSIGLGMMIVLATIGIASGGERTVVGIATAVRRIPFVRTRRWITRLAEQMIAVNHRMRAIRGFGSRRLFRSAMLFLAVWILEAAETYFVLRILGFGPSIVQAGLLESLVAAARLAAFFIPGGFGVQEGGYVGLLAALGLATGASSAAVFLLLKRVRDLLWILGGYGLLLAFGFRASQRRISARTT